MKSSVLSIILVIGLLLSGCGIGGYHVMIFKNRPSFTDSFKNVDNIDLVYKILLPYQKEGQINKHPLFIYIDGSGPHPLDMARQGILVHFQSVGFVAAMKQKRGVKPSGGSFKDLTYRERIQDNLDFIEFLCKNYPQIDSEHVFIMRHSEGATIAGAVAARYPKTAGLIWLSACLNEDFFESVSKNYSPRELEKIEEIRDGVNTKGRWQYYSKLWWYQRFNYKNIPELEKLTCPIMFVIGELDPEYPLLRKRYKKLVEDGKKDISLFVVPSVGHGTIASENVVSLFSKIDSWIDEIYR